MLMIHVGFDCEDTLNERNEQAVRGIPQLSSGLSLALGIVDETVGKKSVEDE